MLRWFVGSGWLDSNEARAMREWHNDGGFSHGVLAPNSALRAQVTALAQETAEDTPSTTEADERDGPDPMTRTPARYLWATLIARLFERFPLTFRHCISTQAKGPLCRRF